MKKKWAVLSTTQAQFIDFISENLDISKRVIFYKHTGHFGMEYALSSRFNKAEILGFKQLKNLKGKNMIFRLLHIFGAISTFVMNQYNNIDARTSIITILNNLENVYLEIDKEKEYLKYLQIKKLPHKYRKIHFILRVDQDDIESDEDIRCLRLLCQLIESRRINNTLLLLSGEQIEFLNLQCLTEKGRSTVFQLNNSDLKFIAERHMLNIADSTVENIELIRKFGLQFFLDNSTFFDALAEIQEKQYDWIKKMDWIVEQIIYKNGIGDKQIYPLLEFSSFFERNFSKLEIRNFNNDQLGAENLLIAQKLAIIDQVKASFYTVPLYSFKLQSFKYYFGVKYISDLAPTPQEIFYYFRKYYPFEYIPVIRLLQIDSSFVENKEKQSLVVIGYYHQNIEKGFVKVEDFICQTTKDTTSATIIKLHNNFKKEIQNKDINMDMLGAINGLKCNSLDIISTCAGYSMILQILRENYIQFYDISFSSILAYFKSAILSIENNNNYNNYWQTHFKCQYIALSLEDENTDNRTAKKFMNDIKKKKEDENFAAFISDNHLRGFTRIELISFSLAYDHADDILRALYDSSEDSTIIKELARINYSAYLIENEFYHDAEMLLKKGNLQFLKNINIDTYCGYLNNLYIAQWKEKTINLKQYISAMENMLCHNISYNDKFIVANNLSVAYLMSESYIAKGLEQLNEIIEKGNPYNRFFAAHNLLAYYFTKNNAKEFDIIYNMINVPKLLLSDKTFFINKFKWMKENIGRTTFETFNRNVHVTASYNQLYLMSSIERWFE